VDLLLQHCDGFGNPQLDMLFFNFIDVGGDKFFLEYAID